MGMIGDNKMNVSKKQLCKKLIRPFIETCVAFSSGLFILFFVVSLFNQREIPFSEMLLLSVIGGVLPITVAVAPSMIINLVKGLRFIGEQEEFYQIEFDVAVDDVMKKRTIYKGSEWYMDVIGFQLIVFRNGFIKSFEKYKKVGNRAPRAYVTAVCADGKKRRLKGSASSIASLRKWVGDCRKEQRSICNEE